MSQTEPTDRIAPANFQALADTCTARGPDAMLDALATSLTRRLR